MCHESMEENPSRKTVTQEMAEAGARVLAARFDQVNDWWIEEVAVEVYEVMVRVNRIIGE